MVSIFENPFVIDHSTTAVGFKGNIPTPFFEALSTRACPEWYPPDGPASGRIAFGGVGGDPLFFLYREPNKKATNRYEITVRCSNKTVPIKGFAVPNLVQVLLDHRQVVHTKTGINYRGIALASEVRHERAEEHFRWVLTHPSDKIATTTIEIFIVKQPG